MTNRKLARRFVQLPADWMMDRFLLKAPPSARLLYLALWTIAQNEGGMDSVTTEQVMHAVPGLPKARVWLDVLVDSGLLCGTSVPDVWLFSELSSWDMQAAYRGSSPVTPHRSAATEEKSSSSSNVVHGHDQGKFQSHSSSSPVTGERVNAAQDVDESEITARVLARVKRERERERENQPNPSGFGSVGSLSSRAAPRGSGGAARPAPNGRRQPMAGEWEPGDPGYPGVADDSDGGTMSRSEATASIRETLNKAKQSVPGSRGKDVRFSKYDPNRPITPIQSAMMNGLGAE